MPWVEPGGRGVGQRIEVRRASVSGEAPQMRGGLRLPDVVALTGGEAPRSWGGRIADALLALSVGRSPMLVGWALTGASGSASCSVKPHARGVDLHGAVTRLPVVGEAPRSWGGPFFFDNVYYCTGRQGNAVGLVYGSQVKPRHWWGGSIQQYPEDPDVP